MGDVDAVPISACSVIVLCLVRHGVVPHVWVGVASGWWMAGDDYSTIIVIAETTAPSPHRLLFVYQLYECV